MTAYYAQAIIAINTEKNNSWVMNGEVLNQFKELSFYRSFDPADQKTLIVFSAIDGESTPINLSDALTRTDFKSGMNNGYSNSAQRVVACYPLSQEKLITITTGGTVALWHIKEKKCPHYFKIIPRSIS